MVELIKYYAYVAGYFTFFVYLFLAACTHFYDAINAKSVKFNYPYFLAFLTLFGSLWCLLQVLWRINVF